MATINLKDLYPHLYAKDTYITVESDALAQLLAITFETFRKEEHACWERSRAHKAYYSYEEGSTESKLLSPIPSMQEMYETLELQQALYAALNELPHIQLRRVYAFFYLGYSKSQIARLEGVDKSSVRQSIDRALKKIRIKLENLL